MQHATNTLRVRVDGITNMRRADTATAHHEPNFVGFFDEHKGCSRRSVDDVLGKFFINSAHVTNITENLALIVKMEWSEEDCFRLIELYKSFPVLWDPKHAEYFKKNSKNDAWKDISQLIKIEENEVRKKMATLLSSYRREKSKIKNSKSTGKGTSEIYVSRWFAYTAFEFLEDRDTPRTRVNTENITLGETENEESIDTQRPIQTPGTSENEDNEFVAPVRPVKKIRRQQEINNTNTALLVSAVDILKTSAGKLQSNENPEIQSFCAYLGSKMSSYSKITRQQLQHRIYDLLIQADMGVLGTSLSSSTQQHSPTVQLSSTQPPMVGIQPLNYSTGIRQQIPSMVNQNYSSYPSSPYSNYSPSPTDTNPSPTNSVQYYSDDANEYLI